MKLLPFLLIPVSLIPYVPIWIKDRKVKKLYPNKTKIINQIVK